MPTSNLSSCRTREFIVVLDDSDRENEGDLIIAAQDIAAEQMAFMIRHTSGLICGPAVPVPCATLELPQMVVNSEATTGQRKMGIAYLNTPTVLQISVSPVSPAGCGTGWVR